MLDLSKLENNKMPVEHIVFNPYHLFQEITDNFMPLAAAKHLELKARFSEDLDKDYSGDAPVSYTHLLRNQLFLTDRYRWV